MKEKIKTFFSVCVVVLAIPYITTLLFQGNQTSIEGKEAEIVKKEGQDFTKEKSQNIEEYLPAVIAKQIPMNYEKETLKAQAVIARTILKRAEEELGKNPKAMSVKEMIELWGQEGFEENYRRLEQAVNDTKGEILAWQEQPADAAYHAVSAGRTRSAKEAMGREEQPYLASTESSMDISSPEYLEVVFLEKAELAETLKETDKKIEVKESDVMEQIHITKRDGSGYVIQMKIGEQELTGEEFRQYLKLNSACFYMKEVEGKIRILTKGLGHGLGLSQYGANELAKEGKDYKEILQYYYKDLTITKK